MRRGGVEPRMNADGTLKKVEWALRARSMINDNPASVGSYTGDFSNKRDARFP